ncbi:MAG: DUF1828 domain-containing protein [Chitinispirillales bacterium]|jgi:hypothetical protein|nr:DUF1828 domain-containing protein [Chitinispirillales bacterium]
MNTWIDKLIDDYYKFLRDRTAIITDTGTNWAVINTPFVGAFNDCIEIYIKKSGDKITLSDDGITLKNLDMLGISFSHSHQRKWVLDGILITYGVTCDNEELVVESTNTNFAQKKHNLIMAISEINDMYMLSKPSIPSIFKEDVKVFLEEQNVIYTPQFISKGRTGLEFAFDFQIAHKNKEIVIKSFNSLSKSNVPYFLFAWDDVKSVREQMSNKNLLGLAFVNDMEKKVESEYVEALRSRNAECVFWSERNDPENLQKLIA